MGLRAALPGAGSAATPAALPACVTGLARLRARLSKCEHTRNQTGTGWDRGQGTGRVAGDRWQQAWSHSGGTGCCWQWHRSPARAQPGQAAGQPPKLRAPLGVGQGVPRARCVLGGQRGARDGAEAVFPSVLAGLCCLQDSGWFAVPQPQLPRALSAAPVQPGRVSWAVFCGAPAPRRASDRRFARAWPHSHGDKGDVVHGSTQLSSCAAQTSPAGPRERVATLGGQEGAGGAR